MYHRGVVQTSTLLRPLTLIMPAVLSACDLLSAHARSRSASLQYASTLTSPYSRDLVFGVKDSLDTDTSDVDVEAPLLAEDRGAGVGESLGTRACCASGSRILKPHSFLYLDVRNRP